MATIFEWSGKTNRGVIESGEITANSKDEVISSAEKKKHNANPRQTKREKTSYWPVLALVVELGDKDIVIFTRQFATMIDAGLPLVQALEILSTQVENKFLAKTLETIKS